MKQLLNTFLFVALSLVGIAYAEDAPKQTAAKEISVQQVQLLIDSKVKNVAILDANNEDARKDAGVVKGAILLTSYNKYGLNELPKDKNTTLVFYCYNSYCQASNLAAQRAIGAGYKDARVMKAGIAGWNAAKL